MASQFYSAQAAFLNHYPVPNMHLPMFAPEHLGLHPPEPTHLRMRPANATLHKKSPHAQVYPLNSADKLRHFLPCNSVAQSVP